jgi:copper chaperone CopZ
VRTVEYTFKVSKIKCEGCAQTITEALGRLGGVKSTHVGIAEREVRVTVDPGGVDEGRLRRALADAGFPAT